MKRILTLALLLVIASLLQTGQAIAAPGTIFTVNQTGDFVDANLADNRCDSNSSLGGDQCSLRAAVQQANSSASTDTIRFVSSATHALTRVGSDNVAFVGDLDITNPVIIEGRSPHTTIDGSGVARVFEIHSGSVTLKNLVIRGGDGDADGFGPGGIVIRSGAIVTISESDVFANSALEGPGGILSGGSLNLDRVTVDNNINQDGEDIEDLGVTGSVTILNSTVGSLRTYSSGNSILVNSTIGGITAEGSTTLRNVTAAIQDCFPFNFSCTPSPLTGIQNSILTSCEGTYISLGYNLFQETTDCTITGNQAGLILNEAARLGRLQLNGGPTRTRALGAGSPAIDGGNPAGCAGLNGQFLTTDQRGFLRPTDGDGDGTTICDLGAFEVGAVGIGAVEPHKGNSDPGELVIFDLAWDSPTRWRDLTTLDLRFKRKKETLLWLRFTEGLPTSTISLLDENGNVVDSGTVGEQRVLKNEFGSLDLAQSGFTASGPNDPHVVVHFAVKFRGRAEGKSKVQMLATDDFANAQGPEPAGRWKIN